MTVSVGKKAPKFLLQDKDGELHALENFGAERVVLYFYPKDDTPGCTLEAIEFSRHIAEFRRQGVAVFGVSGGDNRSKSKFCLKHSLSVPLLSDSDFAVSEAYGVYGEKKFMGRTYKGINRTTFVVNTKSGLIEHVFSAVKPEGHASEVLAALAGSAAAANAGKAVTGKKAISKKAVSKKSGGLKGKRVSSKPTRKPVKVSKRKR